MCFFRYQTNVKKFFFQCCIFLHIFLKKLLSLNLSLCCKAFVISNRTIITTLLHGNKFIFFYSHKLQSYLCATFLRFFYCTVLTYNWRIPRSECTFCWIRLQMVRVKLCGIKMFVRLYTFPNYQSNDDEHFGLIL